MRGLRTSPAFLMSLALLAGCAGGAEDAGDDAFDGFEDADVDESKGVLRGLVIDTSVFPIEGVHVQVVDTQFNATTNEKGAWQIANIPPGLYFLELSKVGFEPIQTNAEAVGGVKNPDPIRVQMAKIPGSEPKYDPFVWSGHLACTFRRPGIPQVVGGAGQSCPEVNTIWPEHDFLVDYELDRVPTYITSDQTWRSTQYFGGEMSFNLRRTDTNCDTIDIEGRSPLHLGMGEDLIAPHDDCRGGFGPDMPLRVIVFTAHLEETEPPTGGWGFGLQYDQDFDVYTHIFYNYAPPEDWRFTDDSTVPEPPE